jgi:hypothetical protein
MRSLNKMQNTGETKHVHVSIKENYTNKSKGHLSHKDLSVIIKDKILLAFPNV